MKADIHFYTGTGNTARAVSVAERALAKKYTVRSYRIDASNAAPAAPSDLVVIAFPVYAWMPPVTMQRYLKRFPRGTAPCVIIAVRGGMPAPNDIGGYTGSALEIAERMLRRKGYDVVLTADAGYPDNWTQFIPPQTGKDISATCTKGDAEVASIIARFLSGERSHYRAKLLPRSITGAIAALFLVIGRRGLGSSFIADEHCNSCGICAKHCPTKTIVMRGKKKAERPYWRFTCEACNRCINICPKRSIQLSLPFLVIGSVFTAGLIVLGIWSLRSVEPFYPTAPILRVIIHSVLITAVVVLAHIAAFSPFARLMFILSGFMPIRRLLAKSHTQAYGRYTAPGFKAGQ